MVDLFLIAVLLWAVIDGWRDGFLKQLASAAGFFVGLLVAATCYSTLGQYLTINGSKGNMAANVVAFFILWIIVPIVLGAVSKVLTKALKGMHLGLPNSLLGAAVSAVKYVILMSCVLNVMGSLRILDEERTQGSFLYEPCRNVLGFVFRSALAGSPAAADAPSEAEADTLWVDFGKGAAKQ